MSSQIDAGAVREVERLTKEANQVLERGVKPGARYLVRNSLGDIEVFDVPTRPLSTTAFDIVSLKRMVNDAGDDLQAVYVADDQITALVEHPDQLDRRTHVLHLPLHPAFQRLSEWKRLTPMTQKDLVRLLRTELREHVAPTVIQTFASLRFTASSDVQSTVRPASSALDTKIQRRVASDNDQDAPEAITFHVPVYDIPEARSDQYDITAFVEYDHEKQAFLLLTVHSDLRAAQEAAVAELVDDLTTHAASRHPVLYGKPS